MPRPSAFRPITALFTAAFLATTIAPPSLLAQRRPRGGVRVPIAHGQDQGDGESGDTGDTTRAPTGGTNSRTGFELELHGTGVAYAGRPINLRGVAYEVIGLGSLRPLPRAHVIAREVLSDGTFGAQPLADLTADAEGHFALALGTAANVVVTIGQGRHTRDFPFSVSVTSPYRLELLTDRVLYEPGETVHAWVRLTDIPSGAPIADRTVNLRVGNDPRLGEAAVHTSPAGVATLDAVIPATAPDGAFDVTALISDTYSATAQTSIRVGRRTVERLLAEVHLDQPVVAPGARVTGTVTVRTPSGAPVRNAQTEIRLAGVREPVRAETDARGIARFAISAPSYIETSIAQQVLDVRINHRAYGALRTAGSFVVARAPYSVEAAAGGGALVPEVTSTVYVTLADPRGQPPPAHTRVAVTGPGVQGGTARAETDAHGMVAFPMRLPRDAAAEHDAGMCAGRVGTSFDVTVESEIPVSARLCAPVATAAQVLPTAASPVVVPGGRVEFNVQRRPAVRGRPVVVDLLYRGENGSLSVVASSTLPGTQDHASLTAPTGYVGPLVLRARPVGGGGFAEGTGAFDALLARPEHAFALELAPEHPVYQVRQTARVLARTPQGISHGFVALVARDLAAHGGEHPWVLEWLRGEVTASAANPALPDAERVLRTALAAFLTLDTPAQSAPPLVPTQGSRPEDEDSSTEYDPGTAAARGDLRDPFALRDELLRRGIMPVERAIEAAVEQATESGDTHGVITRTGRRGFDPAVVHTLIESGDVTDDGAHTLGGGELTVAMLQAVDPGFTFDRVARRVARKRLVRLLASLAAFVDPGEGQRSLAANEPPDRWLSHMVQLEAVTPGALRDPWGGAFGLRRVTPGNESVAIAVQAAGWELTSPGPDGVPGNGDDVRNPFERAVPAETVYAIASGEDDLMRALASVAPGESVLALLSAAYARVGAGAAEESVGDVTSATESAGFGSIGTGSGGGSGSGYGSGRGVAATEMMQGGEGGLAMPAGVASDAPPAPAAARAMPGHRHAGRDEDGIPDDEDANARTEDQRGRAASPPRMAQLAALVRERFPATAHVIAQAPIDASGVTALEIPLADSLTTYRVDAIAWTSEGWTTSASTDVRVDQDAVVDAPVPPYSVVGDRIRLPVRLSNRSEHAIHARLSARVEGGVRADVGAPEEVTVDPGDAREVLVAVTPQQVGEGTLVVTAAEVDGGRELDAARRPLQVLVDSRPVRMAADTVVQGHGTVTLEVPADASFRADGSIRVTVGEAIFGDPRAWALRTADPTWGAWALASAGQSLPEALRERLTVPFRRDSVEPEAYSIDIAQIARAVGSLWRESAVQDEAVDRALHSLARLLDGYDQLPRASRESPEARGVYGISHTETLLGLLPAAGASAQRPALSNALNQLIARLRQSVETNVAAGADDPVRFGRAATALALTGPANGPRVLEFRRRAERIVVRAGDSVFVEAQAGDAAARVEPSALWGLLSLAAGDRDTALQIALTLGRASRASLPRWSAAGRALAHVLALRLTRPTPGGGAGDSAPTSVQVSVDGTVRAAPLTAGIATIASHEISTPGRHTVEVTVPDGAALIVEAESRFGRPWNAPPAARGPMTIALDGPLGARDTRAALVLRLQNRGPRVLTAPVAEIDLPAGAELDEDTRTALGRRLAQPPTVSNRTLVLHLRAMAPGGVVRIPLALRWSVGGSLRGLGVGAYVSDEPGAGATVLASREVVIDDAGAEPEPPPDRARPNQPGNPQPVPASPAAPEAR